MASTRRKIISLVVAAGVIGAALTVTAGLATAKKAPAPSTLRVMTWNIADTKLTKFKDGWVNVIANQKPDVVGLQEVCNDTGSRLVEDLRKKKLEYVLVNGPVDHEAGGCRDFGNALLIKKSIRVTGSGTHRYGGHVKGREFRGYTWANVATAKGVATVATTHLQQSDAAKAERTSQAKELASGLTAGAKRSIVLGDFNAGVVSQEMKPLYALGLADVDAECLRSKGAKCTGTKKGTDGKPDVKIDYLMSRGFTIGAWAVHDTPSSDHKVLVGNLTVT